MWSNKAAFRLDLPSVFLLAVFMPALVQVSAASAEDWRSSSHIGPWDLDLDTEEVATKKPESVLLLENSAFELGVELNGAPELGTFYQVAPGIKVGGSAKIRSVSGAFSAGLELQFKF